METHDCPRCRKTFLSLVKIDGLMCRECVGGSDEWDELASTQPRVVIPFWAMSLQTLPE